MKSRGTHGTVNELLSAQNRFLTCVMTVYFLLLFVQAKWGTRWPFSDWHIFFLN